MHSAVAAALAALLIAGPTLLAFFTGGYFERPRLIAGVLAWVAVLGAVVLAKRPLPRGRAGRAALGGLAALCAWTALSLLWTPVAGATVDDVQRLLLFVGYFGASVVLFRAAWVQSALEPALAAGVLVVTGYALSERLLPDLVELSRSITAGGRLEQPLTYWNTTGALAAIGVVLCVRLAGDARRGAGLRSAGAAAAVPLATGVYLSLSRGALAALTLGLVVLLVLAPDGRAQLRAAGIALVTCLPPALVAALLPAVRTLEGGAGERRAQGLALLAALAAFAALAALLARREARARRPAAGPLLASRGALRGRRLAVAGVAVLLAGAVLAAAALEAQPRSPEPGSGTGRLQSLDSNRYEYWAVALDTFAERPLHGIGSGAFVVEWLQQREVDDPTREPHSLLLGTLAELGLVGLAALLVFTGGVAAAARELWRRDPALAAGPAAALVLAAAHAAIDWDWEMPALALVALALAAAIVAWTDAAARGPASADRPEGSARSPEPGPPASAPGRGSA